MAGYSRCSLGAALGLLWQAQTVGLPERLGVEALWQEGLPEHSCAEAPQKAHWAVGLLERSGIEDLQKEGLPEHSGAEAPQEAHAVKSGQRETTYAAKMDPIFMNI